MVQEDFQNRILLNIGRSYEGNDQKLSHPMRAVEALDDLLLLCLVEIVVENMR